METSMQNIVKELLVSYDKVVKENDELKKNNQELFQTNVSLSKDNLELHKHNTMKKAEKPAKVEPVYYRVGNRFRSSNSNEVYLLAQTDFSEVNLVGLDHGNRWTKPMRTANTSKILKADFDKHFCGDHAPEWNKL